MKVKVSKGQNCKDVGHIRILVCQVLLSWHIMCDLKVSHVHHKQLLKNHM